MDDAKRSELARKAWDIHQAVEDSCLHHPATKSDPAWPEKQRLLLADMAIHLLQTALAAGPLQTEQLRKNLFAILTLADGFVPESGLKGMAEKIYGEAGRPG